MIDGDSSYFFMHVMKTGGSTFVQHIRANFAPETVYPPAGSGPERRLDYTSIQRLAHLGEERRRSIRMFMGHLPFVAGELAGADITMTVLREPVDRTLSLLRHFKRKHPRFAEMSLPQIYDDDLIFALFVHNYQSKLLSMTRGDDLESHRDVIEVDAARLRLALANLERVDVLGLHERYDDVLDVLRSEHGWHIGEVADRNVTTERWTAPRGLAERIAADNAADVELYERARALHDDRARSRALDA